jgi:hypothetical protein
MQYKTLCVCVYVCVCMCVFLSVDSIPLPLNKDQWRALVDKLPSRLINRGFLNSQRNYWLSLLSPGSFKYTFQTYRKFSIPSGQTTVVSHN